MSLETMLVKILTPIFKFIFFPLFIEHAIAEWENAISLKNNITDRRK